jgi:hypothetical protein
MPAARIVPQSTINESAAHYWLAVATPLLAALGFLGILRARPIRAGCCIELFAQFPVSLISIYDQGHS